MAQAGYKWVKRLLPDDSSELIEEQTETYDPKLLYLTLTMTIPNELRKTSPVPQKLYDDAGYMYAFVPSPAKDHRLLIINKVEGQQCLYFRFFSNAFSWKFLYFYSAV